MDQQPAPVLERAALVVVDMQNDFVHPDGAFGVASRQPGSSIDLPALNATISRVGELVEAARAARRPVVYIAHVLRPDYSDAAFPYWRAAPPGAGTCSFITEGTWGAEIVEELRPASGEHLVVKKGFDGFASTELDTVLRHLGVDTCVVCGVTTCVCVSSTVRGASERNYRIVLVADAVAETDRQCHEAELKTMRRVFADVLDTARVVELLGAAGALAAPPLAAGAG